MLTYSALQFSFQLFEKGFVPFLANRYCGKTAEVTQLLEHKALVDAGYASHVRVPAFDDEVEVEIEIGTARNCATYRCPETRKRRDIPLEEARLLQISRDWTSKQISDALAIPEHLKRNDVLMHDTLWKLGACVLDRKVTPIFLARALKTRSDEILHALEQQALEPGAVLLSVYSLPLTQLALPHQMHLVTLNDAFVASEDGYSANLRYLGKLVTGMPVADKQEDTHTFKWNNDAGELCLAGRKQTFFKLQAKIINYLWDRRDDESGSTWCEISSATHAGSRGIDDAMGGKKRREEWIETVSRGRYRLKPF